jgi:hypothetical protein
METGVCVMLSFTRAKAFKVMVKNKDKAIQRGRGRITASPEAGL